MSAIAPLPSGLVKLLPAGTVDTWRTVAPLVPTSAYLAGGTALTVHLLHRVSRDLDFFCEREEDLQGVAIVLQGAGRVIFDVRTADTLSGTFNDTRIQVFSTPRLTLVEPTTTVAGVRVAGVADILAMKLKAILDRGALRDYFDLMIIEQQTNLRVDRGLSLLVDKFRPDAPDSIIAMVIRALGSTDDLEDDPGLPVGRDVIETYWARRSAELGRGPTRTG